MAEISKYKHKLSYISASIGTGRRAFGSQLDSWRFSPSFTWLMLKCLLARHRTPGCPQSVCVNGLKYFEWSVRQEEFYIDTVHLPSVHNMQYLDEQSPFRVMGELLALPVNFFRALPPACCVLSCWIWLNSQSVGTRTKTSNISSLGVIHHVQYGVL